MKRLFLIVLLLSCFSHCDAVRANLVSVFTPEYVPEGNPSELKPEFSGQDKDREQLNVQLYKVADGFAQITELAFFPGKDRYLIVLQKGGKMISHDLKSGVKKTLIEIDVATSSEQGLLGVAFHPDFKSNGLVYLNYSSEDGERRSVVSEFKMKTTDEPGKLTSERVIMEVNQPYQNHNAGRLAFGPDGMLYIGWGDGGWRDDPKEHGQNPKTMLGSMLRIDVNRKDPGKEYAVPSDNPKKAGWLPEAWAIGLRNPWKYSFAPDGRLIVADVGQNKWEEVAILRKGENHGWNTMEATHCFDPPENCNKTGLKLPFYEYDHDEGKSITGGYVYTAGEISGLQNRYIFGDFVSGRIWAVQVPEKNREDQLVKSISLGKWPLLISTFGQDSKGNVYVGNFADGSVYRIAK